MRTTVGPTLIFQAVDLAGVLANGVLGGLLARRLGFDPVGFVVLALISGLGGGVLRDLLLQVPPVALHNPAYLGVALAGAAIAFLVDLRGTLTHRGLVVADALALGAWAGTGATKALAQDLPLLSAILLGLVTAVGGGMIRDLVVREIPKVFSGTLYASVALVAAVAAALLALAGHPEMGMGSAILLAGVLAVAARRFGWVLPAATDLRPRIPHRRRG